ncbi:arginine--tRNA ligase [Helicobacter sp. MIT 14-3879]|uniref:arginine--tRNA ligase n=1 Tax=Helicobacter sp. MIT 14-3879 TaxID=2040649 RepID=UPI000E1EEA12|nr:arginine--tRNA ligase [Helicobacter sp. MIT 14-3879]RDU65095.1 arginine--tRNA ligase [Helicobacter sp. MIT 14-3879]
MYHSIKDILDSALNQNVLLEIPKDSKRGHFATPIAFILSKVYKRPPKEIARELIEKLSNIKEFSDIEEVNGFINITLSDDFLVKKTKEILENKDLFIKQDKDKKNILLEFVSANPTGPLHVGHARGAVFGDTLARIGRALGHRIITEYYINDAGSQIDMLGLSIFIVGRKILNEKIEDREALNTRDNLKLEYQDNYYKGEYIVDLAKEAIEKFGLDIFIDSKNIAILSSFGVKRMLDLIKLNLKNSNIEFDNFVSEKAISKDLSNVLEILQNNNALYEEDCKIWLKSSQKGDEKDRVVVRDSKEPTYLAGDIVYHYDKFKRNFDTYINIWGADHHGYIARIKASIDFLGYDSSKLEVLLSQMVSLLKAGKPYKMSKRAGNFILMQDVIDEIGSDVMRFIFITKKADTHLEFDVDMLKDENNPIYYINYANARIHTILSKSNLINKQSYNFSNLDSMWKGLLVYAMLLPKVLESAFNERALQKLPEYLKSLSSKFHFCYNSSKIIGNELECEIIAILKIVSLSITKGLEFMGVIAKTKM